MRFLEKPEHLVEKVEATKGRTATIRAALGAPVRLKRGVRSAVGSFSKTAKSAHLPGSMPPVMSFLRHCHAASSVTAFNACFTVMRSSGLRTSPPSRMTRVTAVQLNSRGTTGVTL